MRRVLKANPLEFIVIQIQNEIGTETSTDKQRTEDFVGWFGNELIKNFDSSKRLGEYISLGQQILMVADRGWNMPAIGWHSTHDIISENKYEYYWWNGAPNLVHRRGPKAPNHPDRFMRNLNYFQSPPSMQGAAALHNIELTLSNIERFESQSYFGGIVNTIMVDYYETGLQRSNGLRALQIVQYVMRNAGSERFKECQKCPYTYDAMCAGSLECGKKSYHDETYVCCKKTIVPLGWITDLCVQPNLGDSCPTTEDAECAGLMECGKD